MAELGARLTRARTIVDEVTQAVREWPAHAAVALVPERDVERIAGVQRLDLR